MKYNAKMFVIYLLGVLLPLLLMFINGKVADLNRVSWSYRNENTIFQTTLIISLLLSSLIAFLNYKQQKISLWYTISITSAIAIALLLYLGSSLSNFGF